jgi:hypothetical protein
MSADKLPKQLLHKLILKSFEGKLSLIYRITQADNQAGIGHTLHTPNSSTPCQDKGITS